jgi:DivIVA domain-containing protein
MAAENETKPSTSQAEQAPGFKLRGHAPAEIRNVSFPVAMRGYERAAVDDYVARVNNVIAELEVSRSPQAAVRHALDRVADQTSGILKQARESAEQITTTARADAEETTGKAKAEAAEIVVNASDQADRTKAEAAQVLADAKAEAEQTMAAARAEAEERRKRADEEIAGLRDEALDWVRALHADTEAVTKERREMLDDIQGMAARLQEMAKSGAKRFPPRDLPAEAKQTMQESGGAAAAEPTEATEEVGAEPVTASDTGADTHAQATKT